ncbi:GGDEF domain-containing protein [Pseudomonas sp. MDMC216]|jgi:diguanylate cyclase (GGDEF)-like protein|uniref:diguanylate cyclase n=1 Tax=Pseudomonas sihuiensis TaxID=1274359 RepID=A0A1H2LW86_9PSED|nr:MULTISPECIES: GGDEF domain-containing protein [Pseudomonas]MBA4681887.1 GGDEF domain-containing protein [Pseudomonas sp.]MBJ7548362.1 GGDEF domain-containing protein [Pseudomonas sp. OA3]ERH48014.1 diguanylate cyclase [Pseudomonas chengduensis]MBG0846193.1 GGDEF domain-containing protein [Pseudomonas chengduensis]MDH0958814.1 GGDEF domain-containing protein [Pseudomonas chengduensis]
MPGYFAKNEQHRRLVLKALLWITLSGGLFFSVVNLLHDNWLLAGLEIGYAAVSLYLLTIVDRTRNLQLLTAVYLLPFFSIMILALAQTHTSFAVFAWIQSIPIICYLLLGLRLGMYGSVLFVGIGLFVFSRRFSSDQLLQNVEIIANLGLASLAVMIFAHIYERSRLLNEQRLTDQATTDSLTGLPNRLKLAEVFERERAHAQRNGTPLSLVFVDIDHFKQINDRFGHEVGDRALVHFATVLAQRLRVTDLFCRLGGEEFAVLLPGSKATQAREIAESLRERLAAQPLAVDETTLHMTLSAGVACFGVDGQSLDELMLAADRRTYAAKRAGRNRVITREDVEPALG